MTEKVHEPSGSVNLLFKTQTGPSVPEKCPECNSSLHVCLSVCITYFSLMVTSQIAGPMWSGPIHDSEFVSAVLDHLENNQDKYGTSPRMKGMMTVAKEVEEI